MTAKDEEEFIKDFQNFVVKKYISIQDEKNDFFKHQN
jgi:hypothetical protein